MELYGSDLDVLSKILGFVEDLSQQEGVFEVEIRVRLSEGDSWAVLGWGEAGDPCVLRFEDDKVPVAPVNPFLLHPPGVRSINTGVLD